MTIRSFISGLLNFFKPKPIQPVVESTPSPTPTSVSTSIIVLVGDKAVGAIQSISVTEKRPEDPLFSTNVSAVAHRIRFDKQRIAEAFSRGFLHVASQQLPLQIKILEKGGPTTVIQNCWVTSFPFSYHTDNWIIVDEMSLEAELIRTEV